MALMQIIDFDEDGNCLNGSFMDYLIPTSMETPDWELGETCTPSPHHPLGAKGVGESATVGSPPAVVNAGLDASGGGPPPRHAAPPGGRVGGQAGTSEAYVDAVVVRCARPTIARAGDRAVVRADGTIEGFVGGSCADETVRLHALHCLETGEALLLKIVPGAVDGPAEEEGAVVVANPCLSGGALEVF